MDRGQGADRRPHLGQEGQRRQSRQWRLGQHDAAGHDRLARPHPVPVRGIRKRLSALHARQSCPGTRPSSRNASNPVRVSARRRDKSGRTKAGWISSTISSILNTGTIRGRAIVENKDQLLTPGVFGRIQLFAGDIDAILIPDRAIISDQARKIVFALDADDNVVAEAGRARADARGPARRAERPRATDRIVVDGIANPAVRPGVKVKPEPAEARPASN